MRPVSILVALLVAATLIAFVLNRDALLEFAGASQAPATGETADASTSDETAAIPTPTVSVVAVDSVAQSVDNAVVLRGETEAARQVDVRSQTSALVVSQPLRKGAHVDEGQLLCELDPGTRPAALAEAEARLSEAQINFRAADRLADDGFASETRRASARAALQTAQAAVDAARTEISRLKIRAPFSGLLESDTAETGTLLQPGALCATVIQLDPIKLVGFVAETEIDRIAVGAKAQARLATGREVSGTVTFLSRSADPVTRTFRVEVEANNDELSIRDGQTAEIRIASDGRSAHLLPQSVMTLDDSGRLGVRLVDDESRAQFAPVSVVKDTREGAWISGLPETARVIVSGQEFVTDGVPVNATLREARQ